MRRGILAASAALAVLVSGPAESATLLIGGGGPNYDETVHDDHAVSGSTVTLKTKESGYLVDYLGSSTLNPGGNGDGFAKVNGPFSTLTIDPQALVGFNVIGFTLNPEKIQAISLARSKKVDPVLSFQIQVNFAGGGSQIFDTGFAPNQKFDVFAGKDEVISSITFSNLVGTANGQTFNYKFDDIRQVSFDAALAPGVVPEPATWALMIAGFGLAGGAVRSRRRTLAAA